MCTPSSAERVSVPSRALACSLRASVALNPAHSTGVYGVSGDWNGQGRQVRWLGALVDPTVAAGLAAEESEVFLGRSFALGLPAFAATAHQVQLIDCSTGADLDPELLAYTRTPTTGAAPAPQHPQHI